MQCTPLRALWVFPLWTAALVAQPQVSAEYGEIRDGAWRFPTIVAPSRSDLAEGAKVSVTDGVLHAHGARAEALCDGVVGTAGDDPAQAVFFANSCLRGGAFVLDLGAEQDVAQVGSFSYHRWNVDQGGRCPQVYTLAGSRDNRDWTPIAQVDSRPNTTGENWGNRVHGVQIRDAKGLGRFRFLRFEVRPTLSPLLRGKDNPAADIWSNTFYMEIDVHSAATLAASQPARLFSPFPRLEQVVLVFKSHFDIGYTHLASEAVADYRTKMIDGALKVVELNRSLPPAQQFVWTLPGWPMTKILAPWAGQTAERTERVHAAFRAGNFAVHALPFTLQTEMLETEALVRSLGFSSRLARAAGKPLPTGAKMTDVPSHSWILPTLLRHAGVNFLHLGCNPASAVPAVPLLFWWEGPDGSRLLTMYSADYGSGLLPPAGWPHKTWLAMVMRGDNQGPPAPAEVKATIDQIHARLPDVEVRVGQLGDFGERLAAEQPDLPVVRADMPDTWIHGPMCDPASVALARANLPAIAAAETLGTHLAAWDVATKDPADALAAAYEQSILYAEHTWGGAMYWVGRYSQRDGLGLCTNWAYGDEWRKNLAAGRFQRLTASWEEHSDYARHAAALVEPALANELQALARAVDGPTRRTLVYNPLPWPRSGLVQAEGRPRWLADVPAGGYRLLAAAPAAAAARAEGRTLESRWFRIGVDPAHSAIVSWIDKRTGRELVDAGAAHGFGQLVHERYSADDVRRFTASYVRGGADWALVELGKPNLPPASVVPHRTLTPADCTLETGREGDAAVLTMRSKPRADGLSYPVTTRLLLPDDAPWLDLELTADKPADPWPEAGWLALPLAVTEPRFRVGRPGSVIDPAKDIIAGANRYLCAVGTGVALFDPAGRGVGVCGLDTPLVSLGEPGGWRFDRDYVPRRPVVYFNLFNNQWSTNYRFWNEGRWTWRFRLWAFERYDAAASLLVPALEARYPLRAATVESPAGTLPSTREGLRVSRPSVMVTAFGPDPDGEGTVLRVWEQAGVGGRLEVAVPGRFRTATPVSLRGEPTGETTRLQAGRLSFDLGACAPASFRLR